MRYNDALKFIFNLELFGIKMGLDNITRFLAHLGNPEREFQSIHVAGTNGKGSVSAMLFSVLKAQGYKVGMFTSPHLVDFRERVRTHEGAIDKRSLAEFVAGNRQFIIDARITFFEISTALAFWYFRKKQVDYAVVEVGLGGRLDATNVLNPLLSIITHIDLDHTKILGPTLQHIAREKAGIIKPAVPLVSGEQRPELVSYFRGVCMERGSSLTRSKPLKADYQIRGGEMAIDAMLNGSGTKRLISPLIGEHQLRNLAVVLKSVEVLRKRGLRISDGAVRRGIRGSRWPARFQIVSKRPVIVLDAAHNADGMRALSGTFRAVYPNRRAVLLCGFLERPDHDEIMRILAPITRRAVITIPPSNRAAEIEGVIWAAVAAGVDFDVQRKIRDAVMRALQLTRRDDVLLVCGSQYMIGEVIPVLHRLRDRGQLKLQTADITLLNG